VNRKNKHYDVVFSAEIVTIGLLFDGLKLANVDYLEDVASRAAISDIAKIVKQKIEAYLDPQSKVTEVNVEFTLCATAFQKKVLKQLQKIPYGETRTYGEIAKILNTSPRAVGNACRNNPLPIIIPCHRVVAANGIGGYDGARSGALLDIKRRLLEQEGLHCYSDLNKKTCLRSYLGYL